MNEHWETLADTDWQLLHMGHIVRDLDKTLAYYESLGLITAKHRFPRKKHDISFTMDEPANVSASSTRTGGGKLAIVRLGSLPIELIQVGADATDANAEFFDNHGEGISHLAFMVDDLAAETARMTANGVRKLMSMTVDGPETMHYFDTREEGGLMLELIQRNDWSLYLA